MGIRQHELIAVILEKLPAIADTNQIASVLGMSRRTIARWVKSGKLRGTRTAARGGRLLIARQALIDRLNQLGQADTPHSGAFQNSYGGER